jgi:hypothetical protein
MIVTQTPPPANRKHDRTGNFVKRAKLTGEFVKIINDGLYYYEQVSVSDSIWRLVAGYRETRTCSGFLS